MDIRAFFETEPKEEIKTILTGGNWKQTDYFELCSEKELMGCAFLVTLPKQYTLNATAAFINLLQRVFMQNRLLDKTEVKIPSSKEFLHILLRSGFINTPKGAMLETNQFWNGYNEVTGSILKCANPKLLKNGKEIPTQKLLEKKEVSVVIYFANEWNNRQYFIETASDWMFFSWAANG